MQVGDIYPEAVQLKKGEYTIRAVLRHDDAALLDRLKAAESEVVEQARLLGISGSTEARLPARVAELEQQLHIEYQRGWKVGHEVAERDQLLCLARIRAVIGDADGRMTQDEVVDCIAAMRKEGWE